MTGPAEWVDLAGHRPGHAVLSHIAEILGPDPLLGAEPARSQLCQAATPSAVGFCPSKQAEARHPIDNQLLLCRRYKNKDLAWQHADPWLRLPPASKGTPRRRGRPRAAIHLGEIGTRLQAG